MIGISGRGDYGLSAVKNENVVALFDGYLSFRVANANTAKAIATSQNLTTIWGSDHPFRWKWWWMGAHLKMRFPPEYLK